MAFKLPQAARVIENPSAEEVKELAARMPNARRTRHGNLNVQTEVVARSKGSTFLVTDEPDGTHQAIPRGEAERWADVQDAYIAGQEMVQIDGWIGIDPDFRVPARLYIESANANIAGMQQQLYFHTDDPDHEPELTVIYTPNLRAEGMPDGIYVTENGCFAKTFGLNPADEPTIYGAVTQPDSYLENVSQKGDDVDFYDTSYTQNGRATFPFSVIESAATMEIPEAHFLLILNRNEGIIPAVAKLEGPQAAAYFMLGETQGTSAGGAAEEGKFLRVPGTNPFFPLRHGQQGNRILELLATHPIEVFLMNTGRVGGPQADDRSKKVRIPHSSAVVKAIAEGTISWTEDEDFGYAVAEAVPGIDDAELLQPRKLYDREGRIDEYRALVDRFRSERLEFLKDFPDLDEEIIKAVG